jgi:hypothetical protein
MKCTLIIQCCKQFNFKNAFTAIIKLDIWIWQCLQKSIFAEGKILTTLPQFIFWLVVSVLECRAENIPNPWPEEVISTALGDISKRYKMKLSKC